MRAWRGLDELADDLVLPPDWLVCPICGEQSWRFPPHMLDPCPLAIQMAEAQGLKLDAERMMALRTGVHMERLGLLMQHVVDEAEDEDDSEPDS